MTGKIRVYRIKKPRGTAITTLHYLTRTVWVLAVVGWTVDVARLLFLLWQGLQGQPLTCRKVHVPHFCMQGTATKTTAPQRADTACRRKRVMLGSQLAPRLLRLTRPPKLHFPTTGLHPSVISDIRRCLPIGAKLLDRRLTGWELAGLIGIQCAYSSMLQD